MITFVTGSGPALTSTGPTSGSPSYAFRGDGTVVQPNPTNLLVWAQGGALGMGADPGVLGTVPTGAGGCYGTTSTATYGIQVSPVNHAVNEQLVGFCGGNGANNLGGGGGAGGYCSAGGAGGAGCYGQSSPCAQAQNGSSAPGQGGCGGGGGSNSNTFNSLSATTTIGGGGGGIGVLPPTASGLVPAGYGCIPTTLSPGGPNEPKYPGATPKGWLQDTSSCGTGGVASPLPFTTPNPQCALNPTPPCIGNGYTAAAGIGGFGQPGPGGGSVSITVQYVCLCADGVSAAVC